MKWLILILLVLSLALGCTPPQPPEPQLPTPKVPEQVEVAVGEVFTIPLTSNPSTGYDWTVKHDSEMVEYLGYDCEPGRMPPAPGDQSYCGYKFKALKVGETKITLIYERSKERGFAVNEVAEIIEVPVTIQ
ncbi:MAG: protease inhibitor I42 family protein [Dehalococcoidia bacterium]|nr:protease inhibitor I42 family protein [Dehalococcoidia bacterium]